MELVTDISYGILPLQFRDGLWQILLIQHNAGHWAFPKGHLDPGENPVQAAERELKEESGLHVSYYVDAPSQREIYTFYHEGKRIEKTVIYFPAVVDGVVVLQEDEVSASIWVPLLEALDYVTFAQAKGICERLMAELNPEILEKRMDSPRSE